VALGPDLPALFTKNNAVANALAEHAVTVFDPLWRLPLWAPYAPSFESKTAHINNIAGNSFAGAIIAGLFLDRFVERAKTHIHVDLYAWNPSSKPSRPEGGEVQTARTFLSWLKTL
jgi:leucyl aminopeptidase